MSMNLLVYGSRTIKVMATGKTEKQYADVEVWQTPTKITRAIIKASDPLQAYFDWCNSSNSSPEYAEDHIQETSKLIAELIEKGYKLHFEEI